MDNLVEGQDPFVERPALDKGCLTMIYGPMSKGSETNSVGFSDKLENDIDESYRPILFNRVRSFKFWYQG
jgi:hypothetical protein